MPTFVLESADCHVNSAFFFLPGACWDYDTGARVPRGDKMPLLKHAGIST